MALTNEEKQNLLKLKQELQRLRTQPQYKVLSSSIDEIDLSYISGDDLSALTNSQFTQGINFKTLDTSPPFTTTTMNTIAPGSIDVRELKKKMSNQSLLKGRTMDLIDTQQGVLAVIDELKVNADIEDDVTSKVLSQGINLQMINEASNINSEESGIDSSIKSRFVEEF